MVSKNVSALIMTLGFCPAAIAGVFTLEKGGRLPDDISTALDGARLFNFVVSGEGPLLKDVNVRLAIVHNTVSQLTIKLTAPNNSTVTLLSGISGTGGLEENFQDTLLDDEAGTPISDAAAPFIGNFIPINLLSAFDSINNPNGTWKLEVADTSPTLNNDIGYVYGKNNSSAPLVDPNNPTSLFKETPWDNLIGTQLIIESEFVPEPASVLLISLGAFGLFSIRQRRI